MYSGGTHRLGRALHETAWKLSIRGMSAVRCAALGLCALFALAAMPVGISASAADSLCTAPRELLQLSAPLRAAENSMIDRMTSDPDFRIVALGSSSTQGTGASSPKMCYPAQLEAELNRRFGSIKRFEVVNLGVGGQLASNMLARLDTDVLARKPHLVIWQTGVNDAIAGMPITEFRMALAQGVDAILASGADVILLDSQYYPKSARVAGFRDYLTTMRQVAHEKGVALLSRYSIMKHLVDSSQFTTAQLLAPDQFHLNDLSYSCLGHLMANAIGDGLNRAAGVAQRKMSTSANVSLRP